MGIALLRSDSGCALFLCLALQCECCYGGINVYIAYLAVQLDLILSAVVKLHIICDAELEQYLLELQYCCHGHTHNYHSPLLLHL